uniref:Uncharacterized protein n=1 Tax=Peronospora matthiolae TaxID=2874970 RepID=A0AAV1TKK8_9STRA
MAKEDYTRLHLNRSLCTGLTIMCCLSRTRSYTPRAASFVKDALAHEMSSATDEKILASFVSLSDNMDTMKTSQMRIDKDERVHDVIESGMFASSLGANMGIKTMMIDALRNSPER